MASDAVNIVFCCDDKFAGQLQVAALSAALNTPLNIALYVVDCGIAKENIEKIRALGRRWQNIVNVTVEKPARERIFEEFPIAEHFSSAVFYRLAIPKTFPELERAIYLDCDVIVDGDIGELWRIDLGAHAFAAMNDEGNFFRAEDIAGRKAAIGIPRERIYMSSGVLLIDGKRFGEAGIFERVLELIRRRREPLPCPEQDAMNLCISASEYLPLEPRFNFTPFAPLAKRCLGGMAPVIVHYSCGKPWSFNKATVHNLYRFGFFRYSLGFIKKYWSYADKIDGDAFASKRKFPTYYFLYKRTFGKIEYFVAKRLRNGLVRLFKR